MQDVIIQGIGTAVPEFAYPQAMAAERMQAWARDDRERRLIRRVYANSGIETRHSVLADFLGDRPAVLFKPGADGVPIEPGTGDRNDCFAGEARKLAVCAAGRALESCPWLAREDITHVITATCTGFSNPGPDYHLVRDLGLKPSTRRFALGFMGCYAAVPALQMAGDFCRANPSAVVLVVSVELCSLHLHIGNGTDSLLANAIFADGAAAAIVSARPPAPPVRAFRLGSFASALVPAGEKDMAWRIGDHGFDIDLSAYVPDILGRNIHDLVTPVLAGVGLTAQDIDLWAVHPGGKAIVDKVQQGLELTDAQVAAPRHVLREYGNMSSATLLFVLKQILAAASSSSKSLRVYAMAFGPGLTVESAILDLPRTQLG